MVPWWWVLVAAALGMAASGMTVMFVELVRGRREG